MDEPALERDEREEPAAEVADVAAEVALDAPLVADAPTEEAALDAVGGGRRGVSQRGVRKSVATMRTMRTTGTMRTGRSRIRHGHENGRQCTVHRARGCGEKVPLSREHGLFGARVSRVRGSEGRGGEALA